jgi:hypothetical protein
VLTCQYGGGGGHVIFGSLSIIVSNKKI